jgi:ubiquinol-cytochrome c reductase cytochrome c1 subunit
MSLMMRKALLVLLLACAPLPTLASGGGAHLDSVTVDLEDQASLQRGARLFVNYCQNCHAAAMMRFNRVGQDLGISDELLIENLMFNAEKVGETMTVAMPTAYAKASFGVNPPDLSLVARSRGPDWLYTYLRGFYLDPSRPFGVNNRVFKDVGMPHVLWELQGWQQPVYTTHGEGAHAEKVIEKLEIAVPGQLSPAEYDRAMRDLVGFLTYMGEPAKLERQSLGWKVLLFIFLMTIVFYLLKKEYWKDIHH